MRFDINSLQEELKKTLKTNLEYLNTTAYYQAIRDTELEQPEKPKKGRYTQAYIGSQCGVKQTVVSQWKKGKTLPRLDHAAVLAKLYDVSLAWLLSDHTATATTKNAQYKTYSEAFISFLSFSRFFYLSEDEIKDSRLGMNDPHPYHGVYDDDLNFIKDPILRYLIKEYYDSLREVREGYMQEEELESWYKRVLRGFKIPISSPLHRSVYDYVIKVCRKADPFETRRAAAKYIVTHPRIIDDLQREATGRPTFSQWLDADNVMRENDKEYWERLDEEFLNYPYATDEEKKMLEQYKEKKTPANNEGVSTLPAEETSANEGTPTASNMDS